MISTKEELDQIVAQYSSGLLHEFEFVLKLQMSPRTVSNMLSAQSLPYRALAKLTLQDMYDERVENPHLAEILAPK